MRKEPQTDEPTIEELESLIEEQRQNLPPWWEDEERMKFRGDDAIPWNLNVRSRKPKKAGSLIQQVLDIVRERPGVTTREVGNLCGREGQNGRAVILDALKTLKSYGAVRSQQTTTMTQQGRQQTLAWYATDRDAKGVGK